MAKRLRLRTRKYRAAAANETREWVHAPRLRNIGCSTAAACRAFTSPGQLYPRLVLAVYLDESGGIRLTCDRKETQRAWWVEEQFMPLSLVPHLIELIRKAEKAVRLVEKLREIQSEARPA